MNFQQTINLEDYATEAALKALDVRVTLNASCGSRDPALCRAQGRKPGWYGCESFAEMAAIIRGGSEKSTKAIARCSQEAEGLIVSGARSMKPVWVTNRYAGTRLNVERAVQGMPDAWGRFERARMGHGARVIALYVPVGGPANLSTDQIMWAGVPAVVLADMLETAGYRVEVWGVLHTTTRSWTCSNDTVTTRYAIKAPEMPIDFASIGRAIDNATVRGALYSAHFDFQARNNVGSPDGRLGQSIPVTPALWGDDDAIVTQYTYGLGAALAEIKRVIAQFSTEG